MMSQSKMAPLSWRYYAEEIGGGREDCYATASEHAGRFLGRGAQALGIAGQEVSTEALERLFGHGCDPRDGRPLGRSFSPEDERSVAGFALTFSPPKTVSVLWALGDAAVSSAVLFAHETAIGEALAFLEDHAAFTRRGHGGILQVDTDGLVVASFVHRTSRASDPQLHTHALVANKVRARDGHWLSLDARELFCHQKAAGMLYKAALRAELTARCGVSWTFVDDNGIAEVEGVPVELCDAWSARRHAVKAAGDALVAEREAALGRSLTSSERAQCFQLAAYRTRTPKVDAETPTEVLKQRWHEEAVGFGHDPERFLAGVLGHERGVVVTPGVEELTSALARLEERSATWTRADVVEECARLVDAHDAGGVRRAVEALADEVLRDPEVVSLEAPLPVVAPELLRREDGMAQLERHGGRRFSTTGTLRREAAVLEAAAAGAGAGIGIVPEAVVTSAISDARLGEDQEAAVRGLLAGGEQVALLVGPAGSGKSRALSAARTAWEASGHEVVGAAPSAMAAEVLEEASGIASDTLAKLLGELERGQLVLSSRSVVVVDEAGMARSDDLSRLLTSVKAASAKVVLVGDPHQLGAVGPGGLFRTLVDDHGAVSRARDGAPLHPRLGGRGVAAAPRARPVDPSRIRRPRPHPRGQPPGDARRCACCLASGTGERPRRARDGGRQRDGRRALTALSGRAGAGRRGGGRRCRHRLGARRGGRRGGDAAQRPVASKRRG